MFEKKIFSQTHSNKAGNGFENSKMQKCSILFFYSLLAFKEVITQKIMCI